MTPEKAANLIQKLLKVAAVDSGATEAERANAALEVCRLLNEKGAKKPDAPAARAPEREPRRRPYWAAESDDNTANYGDDIYYDEATIVRGTKYHLVETRAPYPVTCNICKGDLSRGEHAWCKSGAGTVEYYHHRCL